MAKLSEEVLEEGRLHIKNNDMKSLKNWLEKYNVPVKHDVVVNDLGRLVEYDRVDKALKLFKVIEDIDIDFERRVKFVSILFYFILLLGVIGGILFVTSLFL